jgi:hypothetical protein
MDSASEASTPASSFDVGNDILLAMGIFPKELIDQVRPRIVRLGQSEATLRLVKEAR